MGTRPKIPLATTYEEARKIPATFLDKNTPDLNREVHHFFRNRLGFGDFVFRTREGLEIDRASNLNVLEKKAVCHSG